MALRSLLLSLPTIGAEPQPSYYDAGLSACVPGAGHDHYPFCDVSLPIDDRVNDLISRIDDSVKPHLLTARGYLKNQGRQALPELGVPSYYWGSNCIHSSMSANCTKDGRCSTNFPSGPSWAATFDRELMQSMASVAGREQRAFFNLGNWTDNGQNGMGLDCWGPVLNLNRDPRWGRHGEGGTEDPYLMGELGTAWTKGLQGDDPQYLQIAVTLKHFDANSLEGGAAADEGFNRHTVDVNLTKYLLADYYWPAFRASIRNGNAKGVMCSYNNVNGRPTCTDPLMRAARATWNFTGYVTSDSDAVEDAWDQHHTFATAAEASCAAVRDGQCDIDSGNTYYNSLLDGVAAGHCAMEDVDRALFNTFRVRFELGLFDPIDTQRYWKFGEKDINTKEDQELNLKAAEASLVLVHNSDVLPLTPGRKLAVIGPHGNATMDLVQCDTGAVCLDGANDAWKNHPELSAFNCVESPMAALQSINQAAGGSTTYTQGCDLFGNSTDGIADALAAAKAADVVVLGLGISERTGGPYMEAESHDRDIIDLPPVQKQLAKALLALGKPTVVFLLNAGMVAVEELLAAEMSNLAIIEAFYPGTTGAKALANSIYGVSNRWGKMPYTIYPANWTEQNSMLDHDVTHKRTYRYGAEAVVPFGRGLSLTKFTLDFGSTPSSKASTSDVSKQRYKIKVTNAGSMKGDEVVMAYFHPKEVDLKQFPQKSLFDFQRVSDLEPGSSVVVSFALSAESLVLATQDGDLVRAPGKYVLSFENGAGEVLTADLELSGEQQLIEAFPKVEQETLLI